MNFTKKLLNTIKYSDMEDLKKTLIIDSIIEGELEHIKFSHFKGDEPLNDRQIVTLLTKSLAMSIKVLIEDMDYEDQGTLMKNIISYIEDSFASVDSFKNLTKH